MRSSRSTGRSHRLAGGFVQVEQAGDHEGVIGEIGVVVRGAAGEAAPQAAVDAHAPEDEPPRRARALRIGRIIEDQRGARERRDHQAVPGGKDLVVAQRRRPPPRAA
jgi:hypothetical protein